MKRALVLSTESICLDVEDYSVSRRSAVQLFRLKGLRDPNAHAARLAQQFVDQNRSLLARLDVRVDRDFDGNEVTMIIQAGCTVGAIPLLSPTSARPDYGLVVRPRFAWAGVGLMLAEMGWRVAPAPLQLPLLRRSERRVPIWVLAYMTLKRLEDLLDSLARRFEFSYEVRRAPAGRVDWSAYAARKLPHAGFLSIPCTVPDLREDRRLKGAVRYAVERQLIALETQKEHGAFVHRLIEFGQRLRARVSDVPAYLPTPLEFRNWLQGPLRNEHLADGVQAIEWTIDERGLAGMSDLEGIPWSMPMDAFFEAWVETLFRIVALRTGAAVKVGRKHETTQAIHWDPPYLGSQKSLVPDLWLEWESLTLVVDAKYKRHWEEQQQQSWAAVEQEIRDRHRGDLLQVLAYANLSRTKNVIACLMYPCSPNSWESLRARGRLVHKAEITIGDKALRIWLTAVPMATTVHKIAEFLTGELSKVISARGGT